MIFNARRSIGHNTTANLTEYDTQRENNTTMASSIPTQFRVLSEINEDDSHNGVFDFSLFY